MNFDPSAAQTRRTAPQAGPRVTKVARSSESEEAPPLPVRPPVDSANPRAPSTTRLPRHFQSNDYIQPRPRAPRSGKVSREPIGAEWGRGQGQGAGRLRRWGGARSAQSGAIGHPWQEPHLGQQQRRPREGWCGAGRWGPVWRVGRDSETAGGGCAQPDPAPIDATRGSTRVQAAGERLGNKCARGSGGGDAGPGVVTAGLR